MHEMSFGALRLQNVVRKSIKVQNDRTSINSVPTSQSVAANILSDQLILKSMNLISPLQNLIPEEENESPLSSPKKKAGTSFQLQISSSSSDNSLSLSPVNKQVFFKQSVSYKQKIGQQEQTKVDQEDQHKAISTLKSIMRKRPENEQKSKVKNKIQKQETNHKLLSNDNSTQNIISHKHMRSTYGGNIDQDSVRERFDKKGSDKEKRQINFLKGLNQNQTLNDNAEIEEYYQDGKIVVNMHSRDLMTFVRLQHEVDELKRKQDDFNAQKERHFNLAKKENEQNIQKKNEKSEYKKSYDAWWVGIALAKRFLRLGRKSQSDQRLQNKLSLSPNKDSPNKDAQNKDMSQSQSPTKDYPHFDAPIKDQTKIKASQNVSFPSEKLIKAPLFSMKQSRLLNVSEILQKQ